MDDRDLEEAFTKFGWCAKHSSWFGASISSVDCKSLHRIGSHCRLAIEHCRHRRRRRRRRRRRLFARPGVLAQELQVGAQSGELAEEIVLGMLVPVQLTCSIGTLAP